MAVWMQKRLKCAKLTDDRRWTPSVNKSSHGLWLGELKMHVMSSTKYMIKLCNIITEIDHCLIDYNIMCDIHTYTRHMKWTFNIYYVDVCWGRCGRNKEVHVCCIFSSPSQRPCELLLTLGVHRRSSVNFAHFNLFCIHTAI
jgi:hypothetical protein